MQYMPAPLRREQHSPPAPSSQHSKPLRPASLSKAWTPTRTTSLTRLRRPCEAKMVATGLPTRSSIQAWDVQHLTDAADHWEGTADRWENASLQVWQEAHGLNWQGQTRDALIERVTNDKTTVMSKADQLREAAQIARTGAGDISAAQRRVLYGIEDAHNAGFVVGEDLSVNDTRTSSNPAELAARQAQAQTLAADIRERAAQLVGVDTEVGSNITGAAGNVGDATFTETPVTSGGQNGTIQMAGHGFKQDPQLPSPPPAPPPGPPPVKLPPNRRPFSRALPKP